MDAEPTTVDLLLGRFTAPPPLLSYEIATDALVEPVECLVITLSINETALDPRDQGQVDFNNSVALVRIKDAEIGMQAVSTQTSSLFLICLQPPSACCLD